MNALCGASDRETSDMNDTFRSCLSGGNSPLSGNKGKKENGVDTSLNKENSMAGE